MTVVQDVTVPIANQVKLNGGTYTGSVTGAPTITSATKSVSGATTTVNVVGTSLTGASNSAIFELKTNPRVV